jgi:hypothetical protein
MVNEQLCITYAKQMLEVEILPPRLYAKLIEAERMIQRVKPGGFLSSTQTISTIIFLWQLEEKMLTSDQIGV